MTFYPTFFGARLAPQREATSPAQLAADDAAEAYGKSLSNRQIFPNFSKCLMSQQDTRIYEFGDFRLDAKKRTLVKTGEPILLPPKAMEILLALIENRERVVEKEELMEKIWAGSFVEEANLTVTMSALRKALGESKTEHPYILTFSKRGYRFVADVKEIAEKRQT